jgi:hypothetical protein
VAGKGYGMLVVIPSIILESVSWHVHVTVTTICMFAWSFHPPGSWTVHPNNRGEGWLNTEPLLKTLVQQSNSASSLSTC